MFMSQAWEKEKSLNLQQDPRYTLTAVKREKFAKVKQITSKLRLLFSLF